MPDAQPRARPPSGGWVSRSRNEPVVVVTADVDWGSEACIEDFTAAMGGLDIVPTLFATHASPTLDRLAAAGRIELGIHPNFFPGSSHGESESEVLDTITQLFPQGRVVRAHGYYDHSRLAPQLLARGIADDSTLCLFLEAGIAPIAHWTGLRKWPVFWEDDIHWTVHGEQCWSVEPFTAAFLAPGLKILDIHPFNFAFNIDGDASYARLKHFTRTAHASDLARHRIASPGSRSFILEMLGLLAGRGVAVTQFSALMKDQQ